MTGSPGPTLDAPEALTLALTPALRSALFQGACALSAEAEFLEEGARTLATAAVPPRDAVEEMWSGAAEARAQAALLMSLYRRTQPA